MIKEIFETFDKFGNPHVFLCEQIEEDNDNILVFHIKTLKTRLKGDIYEFELEKINNQIYKIKVMHNHGDDEYINKGITEYLIPFIMDKFNIRIVSSVHKGFPGEFRSEKANEFWERMVKKNKAKYDDENDRYEYIKEVE